MLPSTVYSMSTYFRMELIDPSAREVFVSLDSIKREKRASEEGEDNMAQTKRDSK